MRMALRCNYIKISIVLLCLNFLGIGALSAQDCEEQRTVDSLVLANLYNTTGADNWTVTWDLSEPMPTWFGVTMDEENCGVERLELSSNGLDNSIPEELFLTKLKVLDFSENELTGFLMNYDLFPLIEEIYLNDNQFYGIVPFFSQYPELHTLNIANNFFSFDGLEDLMEAEIDNVTYAPQADIPLIVSNNKIEVQAGGTVTNNTYTWYKDGQQLISIIGDEDILVNEDGVYYVEVRNSEVTVTSNPNQNLLLKSEEVAYSVDCDIPATPFLLAEETSFCIGTTEAFEISVKDYELSDNDYFQWYLNGEPWIIGEDNVQSFVDIEEDIEVSVIVTDATACSSEISNTVFITFEECGVTSGEEETEEMAEVEETEEVTETGCPDLPTPFITVDFTTICELSTGDIKEATLIIGPEPDECNIAIVQDGIIIDIQKDTIYTITEAGEYFVFFVDSNGCESDRSNSVFIDVINCSEDCDNEMLDDCSSGILDPIILCPDFCKFPTGNYAITQVTTQNFSCSINIVDQFCVRFTPLPAFNGQDTLQIIACNLDGFCDTVELEVLVDPFLCSMNNLVLPNTWGNNIEAWQEVKLNGGLGMVVTFDGQREFGEESTKIDIYPNPANEVVYIDFGSTNNPYKAYSIYNVLGQKITEESLQDLAESYVTVPVENYLPGVYFIKVNGTDKPIVKQIVIK